MLLLFCLISQKKLAVLATAQSPERWPISYVSCALVAISNKKHIGFKKNFENDAFFQFQVCSRKFRDGQGDA